MLNKKSIRKNYKFFDAFSSRKSISPVIAVILLLAITVVLSMSFFSFIQNQIEENQNLISQTSIGTYQVLSANSQEIILRISGNTNSVKSIILDGFKCGNKTVKRGNSLFLDISTCSNQINNNIPVVNIITQSENIKFKLLTYKPQEIFSNYPLESPNCYDPANVNTIGTGYKCLGMLIVNRTMLNSAASSLIGGDESYSILGPDSNNYTFENSEFNIFTGQITNMDQLFVGTFFNGDINYWDVSNVERMQAMFALTSSFNQPLNSWNVSSVTDMFFYV